MSTSIFELISSIPDSQSAKIMLPITGASPIHLNCVYKQDETPHFLLVFPPHSLPDNIDTEKPCSVAIKNLESPVTFNAMIDELQGDRTIRLAAKGSIDPASLREYFRVNVQTSITASYEPGSKEKVSHRWTLDGETIDLSASGVLAIFPKELVNKHKIFIDLKLPFDQGNVTMRGHVVRMKRVRKNKYQVAFHFDEITTKHRDLIISCCFQIQRHQLRHNVRTSG